PISPSVRAQGVTDRRSRVGCRVGAAARPDASRLDGRAALRLSMSAACGREPVGLADPLPDRCPRGLGWLARPAGPEDQGRPRVWLGDQESIWPGNRHVRPSVAVPHPTRVGLAREGAEQRLEAQLRAARRDRRDLVATLYLHPELESDQAG